MEKEKGVSRKERKRGERKRHLSTWVMYFEKKIKMHVWAAADKKAKDDATAEKCINAT